MINFDFLKCEEKFSVFANVRLKMNLPMPPIEL